MRILSALLWIAIVPFFLADPARAVLVRDHRSPSTSGGAYTLGAQPVFEMTLALTAGRQTSCETRNLSRGADPVLHLLAPNGDLGNVNEVARDDDSGGQLNARFTFRPMVTGRHRLIIRAAGDGRIGTADLYCDGRIVWVKLPVGGAFKRLEGLRQGEILTTLPLPQAPTGHLVYLFDDNGRMLRRHVSGANQGVVVATGAMSLVNVMVGSIWPDITGPLRLVRNDALLPGHDPDGDNLGTELESQIGTCSTRNEVVGGWDCSRSADPRDTDGDGLSDDWELLGIVASAPYQLLPRWGADPLHKDLFIQVDSRLGALNEAPKTLDPAQAREMAAVYGDPEPDALLRLLHAQSLQNPDLKAGIHVHLDTGVSPPAGAPASDFTTYGDWGGHGVVGAICSGPDCHVADAADVWQTHLQLNRRGVFHYALGYPGSGGQAPFHTVALNYPLDSGFSAAHELGHTLGLDHSGPVHPGSDANCKPNYPSVMSYAFLGSPGFKLPSFADGFGRPALNNAALREVNAVLPAASQVYLQQLRDVLHLKVDLTTGSVDWNRDGVFSGGAVRAYANDNGECEFTRVNSMPVPGLSVAAPAITRLGGMTLIFSIDEASRRLRLALTRDDLGCPGIEGRCGPPLTSQAIDAGWNRDILAVDAHRIAVGGQQRTLVVFRTAAGLFESEMTADLRFAPARAIPGGSLAIDEFALTGNEAHTIMAYKSSSGAALIRVRSSNPGNSDHWNGDEPAIEDNGQPILLAPGSSPGLLEAPMSSDRSALFAVFPGGDNGALRLYVQDPATGRWTHSSWGNAEERSIGRPAMAMVPVDPQSMLPGNLRILSLLREAKGNFTVRMHSLEVLQDSSVVTGASHSASHPAEPITAFPDRRPTPRAPGEPNLPPRDVIRLVDEHFDNEWYYGNGVALLFEDGVDSNLRAVISTALLSKGVPQPHVIELRPKADGIVDFVQRNENDWQALGIDLCRTLSPSGSAGIVCPQWLN